MYLINELCSKTMWLTNGEVSALGETPRVIGEYLAYLEEKNNSVKGASAAEAKGASPELAIQEVCLVGEDGGVLERGVQFQPLIVQVRTRRNGPPLMGHMAVTIEQPDGQLIFSATTKDSNVGPIRFVGDQATWFIIPSMPLIGGRFVAKALVGDQHTLRLIDQVKSAPFLIEGKRPELGMFWMDHRWQLPEMNLD
jgi:hypothetical protein